MAKKSIAGLFGKLMAFAVVMVFIYAAYLFLIFKKMPSAMSEVSGIYGTVMAARMGNTQQAHYTDVQAAPAQKRWTTISSRTTDEQLKAMTVDKAEIKKMETYEKVLDSNSMKVINALLEMVNGKKDGVNLTAEEETTMKKQIDTILNAYKPNDQDMKEIEKEIGK
jgi:hypothetical protein